MEEPTIQELQDQIRDLQKLVKPEHVPFDGPEYSFPSLGRGITMREHQLMSLGQANGIIHGDNGELNTSPDSTGYRYYLDGHPTDAETNSKNTLILRAGKSAEAIIEGFYHRLTEDKEISYPPVTTPTTYYTCLTYDPEEEADIQGPVSIQNYASKPPSSKNRVHVLLHTVERQPNQLLTEAKITMYRPYTAGIVAVQNNTQLPAPDAYPAGTLAVTSGAVQSSRQGIYVRSNTTKDWHNLLVGEWVDFNAHTGNLWTGGGQARRRAGGVDVWLSVARGTDGATSPTSSLLTLPDFAAVAQSYYTTVWTTFGPQALTVSSDGSGRNAALTQATSRPPWTRGHFFIPDHFLRTP